MDMTHPLAYHIDHSVLLLLLSSCQIHVPPTMRLCNSRTLYVDDILLIGNDIEFLDSIKGYLNKNFLMKDLGEAAYILGIKIYRDRSRCLIGLSLSTYVDKVLKKFKMDQSKKGFLPVLQGVKLSQTQCPTTTEDREKMKVIPYA